MGFLLIAAGVVGFIYFGFRGAFSASGRGERRAEIAAQAEYAQLRRESPDHPEAVLSEPEYVQRHMKKGPSVVGNFLLALLCLFLLIPLGCVAMVAG